MDSDNTTTTPAPVDLDKEYVRISPWKDAAIRLSKNRGAMLGLAFLVLLFLVAISADLLYNYDTEVIEQNISERLQWPSSAHPFGTDEFGRDILARIVHGSRRSLLVSFASVILGMSVGGVLGAVAGYFGKHVDNIIMRCLDVAAGIPMTMFAIVIVAALGPNTTNLILALGFSSIPSLARVVRGAVLTVREVEYVEAARAIGAKDSVILTKHILPNCMAPIIVQATLQAARAMYNTSALSFLGMGVQPPAPEWGSLLSGGRTYIRDYSYMSVIPGIVIMLTILALNLLGDGLRDALDPRLK